MIRRNLRAALVAVVTLVCGLGLLTVPAVAEEPPPSGLSQLQFAHSNKCLRVPERTTDGDYWVEQGACDGRSHWDMRRLRDPEDPTYLFYEIRSTVSYSNNCLWIKQNNSANGARVIMGQCLGSGSNQDTTFTVTRLGPARYHLWTERSRKLVCVVNNSPDVGAKVHIWSLVTPRQPAQELIITPLS